MTEWRCLILSAEGRADWRMIEAPDRDTAATLMMSEGLTLLDIRSGAMGLAERLNQPMRLGSKLGIHEQALLLTQLAMLTGSGLPIDRSLDLLRDQSTRAVQRDLLAEALNRVRAGGGLAQALERTASFPDYVIGVVRSAERSGRMVDALTGLAGRLRLAASTRRQLITALTYPAAVMAATLIALLLVLTMVVPQFEPVFEGEEDRLPSLTRLVLALSRGVTGHGGGLLLVIGGAIAGLVLFLRSDAGRLALDRHRNRLPGMHLRDQYIAAQFTGILATLIANGVSIVTALPLTADALGSRRWKSHLTRVEQRIREGYRLSDALANDALVPSTVIRLIEVGERTGKLADTCRQASEIIAEAAKSRIDRIVALANPIAIVTLGGLVGLLVAGVMLGIFALGDFGG